MSGPIQQIRNGVSAEQLGSVLQEDSGFSGKKEAQGQEYICGANAGLASLNRQGPASEAAT